MRIKKIFFFLISVFLLYRSYELILNIINHPDSYSTTENWILPILINLFITGFIAFLGFALPTSTLLSESYYLKIDKERISRWYQNLGVKYFHWFLLQTFWKSRKQKMKYFDGKKSGLQKAVFESKQAEFGHLIAGLAILFISAIFLYYQQWLVFTITNLINLFFNFYPVVMQRFLRRRILQLVDRNK